MGYEAVHTASPVPLSVIRLLYSLGITAPAAPTAEIILIGNNYFKRHGSAWRRKEVNSQLTVSTQGRRRATRWGEGCGGSRVCGPRFPFPEAGGCPGSEGPPALRPARPKPRREAGTPRRPLRRVPLPSPGRPASDRAEPPTARQLPAKGGQTNPTASLTSRAGREEQPSDFRRK